MSETARLEEAFKRSLLHLGLICRFYADVAQLGIGGYARHAPNSKQLKQEAERYLQGCDELRQTVLLARATLERDIRKANGLSPLPVPTKSDTPLPSTATTESLLQPAIDAQAAADDIAMQIVAPSFTIPESATPFGLPMDAAALPQVDFGDFSTQNNFSDIQMDDLDSLLGSFGNNNADSTSFSTLDIHDLLANFDPTNA